MVIESVENEKVKLWKKLRTSKYISIYKKFIVEGFHLVEEANKSGRLLEIIALDGSDITIDAPITYVSSKVMKSISLLDSVPPIMAVVSTKEVCDFGEKIVILDDVQDPGNIGTIIRNAVAFGIDTVVLSKNSTSVYNDKLVRASQGMCFHVNVVRTDIRSLIPTLKDKGISIYGTALDGSKEMKEVKFSKKFAVIFGNEGLGMSDEIKNMCDDLVRIEIKEECESLNVGCSCAIILYNLMEREL